MTDRRRSARVAIDVLFNTFQDGLPTLCISHDIGAGGIGLRRLHAARPLSAQVVDIEIELPGCDGLVTARGRAISTATSRVAVQFEELSERDRRVLDRYLDAATS